MIKVLIVEDEFKSRELLKILLLENCPEVQIVGMAGDIPEALVLIKSKEPELLFLDVELGHETGFDLLEQVNEINFAVIFTTAHSHYALKAIKFSAMDYLLKPINIKELQLSIGKMQKRMAQGEWSQKVERLLKNLQVPKNNTNKIGLPTTDGIRFVAPDEILYCNAEGAYTMIYVGREEILVSKNLREYEALLNNYSFCRIHNSHLINLNHVKKYIRGEGGYVIMSNDVSITISKRRKEIFLAAIAAR
jgi:two-component system LytT family response regulator